MVLATGLNEATTDRVSAQESRDIQAASKFRPAPQKGVPDQYIVTLTRREAGPRGDRSRASALGSDLAREYGITRVRSILTHVIGGFVAEMTEATARALSQDTRVASVTQEQRLALNTVQVNPGWGLDRIDQPLGLNNQYQYSNTGAGVTLYVVDNGIRSSHSDFGNRVTFGAMFVNGGGPPIPPPLPPPPSGGDPNIDPCYPKGHGTAVASVAGGEIHGVAEAVNIIDVQVANGCFSFTGDLLSGINWVIADHATRGGPAVANVSIGGDKDLLFNNLVDQAVRDAVSAGVVFVIAAGNDGIDADEITPARVTQAITVGATDISDNRAIFSSTRSSNVGPVLDLFAPGKAVATAWSLSDTYTATLDGTSFASPYVAGIAARYLEYYPNALPVQVQDQIVTYASDDLTVGNAGAGSPNRIAFSGFLNSPPPPPPPPPGPGRWKNDGYGGCYFDQYDSGPDQCDPDLGRWKDDGYGGCYYDEYDSGPDQCSPPPLESAATFSSATALATIFLGIGFWRLRRRAHDRTPMPSWSTPRIVCVLLVGAAAACSATPPSGPSPDGTYAFDFRNGTQGWVPGAPQFYGNLTAELRPLAGGLASQGSGLFIQIVSSDNPLVYYKRRVTGLSPTASYRVTFSIEIATNTPSGCLGFGGYAAEKTFVRAGATTGEPITTQEAGPTGPSYRYNFD